MTRRNPIRLAWIAAVMFGAVACGFVHAQASYDCLYVKTAKVARVQGMVLDQQGKAVSGAGIELLKRGADNALASTRSDAGGGFRFNVPAGPYWVDVKANGFQRTGLSVSVDRGLLRFFRPRQVFIVLAAGTAQSCPSEITSKKKLQEYIRDNATQK